MKKAEIDQQTKELIKDIYDTFERIAKISLSSEGEYNSDKNKKNNITKLRKNG